MLGGLICLCTLIVTLLSQLIKSICMSGNTYDEEKYNQRKNCNACVFFARYNNLQFGISYTGLSYVVFCIAATLPISIFLIVITVILTATSLVVYKSNSEEIVAYLRCIESFNGNSRVYRNKIADQLDYMNAINSCFIGLTFGILFGVIEAFI